MVVLAAVAAATWLYGRPPPITRDTGATAESAPPLGYYLLGARLLGTDEQGRVAYQILADRLEEVPDQQGLKLEGVQVEYRPADAVPWLISAARAEAPKDGSSLELQGNVELRSEPTEGEPIHIATDALSFVLSTSSAQSESAVRVEVGDWRLDAVGFRTYLKGDSMELESQVHGKFSR
jgi:LPS export ABC transporter protein LptC